MSISTTYVYRIKACPMAILCLCLKITTMSFRFVYRTADICTLFCSLKGGSLKWEFFFVKSWAIVHRLTSKKNILAWDLFWVCFDPFYFFHGSVIFYSGLFIDSAYIVQQFHNCFRVIQVKTLTANNLYIFFPCTPLLNRETNRNCS